jgi:hypothetical protein
VVLLVAGVACTTNPARGTFTQTNQQPDQTTAIQQAIQQSDAEQVQAISSQDASSMSDTSTPQYYQQMQQTNQQLLSGGVVSISLNGIEWGPINVNGTTAKAQDFETWTTVYNDSSTEESRDENDYTLVQQNGTWLIESDTQPNAVGRQRGTRLPTPAPATRTPSAVAVPTPESASRSSNWAGYASIAGTFGSVSGTWTVPAFSPSSASGMDATWVGIGGVNTQDLIQAGTQQQTSGSGQTLYSAWVETLPQPSQPVALVVREVPLSQTDPQAINLQNASGQTLVETSAISTDGQSFTTTRTDVQDTQLAGRRTRGRTGSTGP